MTPPHLANIHHLSQGFVPIPKSVSRDRIVSNGDVFGFELSQGDMNKVRSQLTASSDWSSSDPRSTWYYDIQLNALDEHLVTDWDVVDSA